ncbi:MAG TPA: Hsp33 family molecular chaperone HslO [Rudaea sp.]|nr:Hsp33 family molecular chaperone HslO [Rudaea sp.]
MSDDFLQRFLLERAHVRGVLVRLRDSWRQVRERADYPAPIERLLAKTLAASAVLTGNIKFEGSLSIQLKGQGPVTLLFAECGHDGRVRGLARWEGEVADDFSLIAGEAEPVLAITIENSTSGQRYQGLVPVDDADPAVLIERYFERSEQLPTRVALAADARGCAALMLQQLPADEARGSDPDAWNRVNLLLGTLREAELLELPAEQLLLRLFHEESVRAHTPRPLAFGCRCSRERVAGMLHSLGREEAEAAVRDDGQVEVTCEFCNTHYRFDRIDLEQLFRAGYDISAAPTPH